MKVFVSINIANWDTVIAFTAFVKFDGTSNNEKGHYILCTYFIKIESC
jgi:hypothetical protein